MGMHYYNCANCCEIYHVHESTGCRNQNPECYSRYCPDCKKYVYKNDCGKCTKDIKKMILSLEEKYNFLLKYYNIDDMSVIKMTKASRS